MPDFGDVFNRLPKQFLRYVGCMGSILRLTLL